MTNYTKSCSFLHAHFFEYMKVVENLFKKAKVKNSIIEKTYVVSYLVLYVPFLQSLSYIGTSLPGLNQY